MVGEWRETTIGEFAPFAYGKGLPEHARNATGGVPVFGSNGLVGLHDAALTEGPTVVIGRKGTVGAVHYSSVPCWPIDTTFWVTDPDRAVLRFKYYLLKSIGLEYMNADSAVPGLNREAAHARRILVPPLPEQRAIAHILGTLDDKIELNRRISETLEQMARAIFKAWFVDFEPVRAKMNSPSPFGRGARGEGARSEGVRRKETKGEAKKPPLPEHLLHFARQLRKNATDAENLLWRLLRNRQLAGAKFRRQHPVPPYVLDFYCHEQRLAVEIDGGQHNQPDHRRRDARRSEFLAQQGIRVLRFWSDEVLRETEAVLEAIYDALTPGHPAGGTGTGPHPNPLPEGEGVKGWPQHILDLFPDRLVDSELGEIPEGWEVGTIGDLADVVGGSTPSTKEPTYWEGGIHYWATPKDLSGLRVPVLLKTDRKITDAGLAQISSGLLPRGTVLLSSRAPIGYLAIAEVPVAINQGFIAMKPRKGVSNLFLLLWATFAHDDILSRANGSTFQEISKASFRPIPVVLPPAAIMQAFDDQIRPFYGRIVGNERESRTLAALRDALLPKLIHGEIRVKDVERFLEKRGYDDLHHSRWLQ